MRSTNGDVEQRQVGGLHDGAPGPVDRARDAETDSANAVGGALEQQLGQGGDALHHRGLGLGCGRHDLVQDHVAVLVDDAARELGAADVDAEYLIHVAARGIAVRPYAPAHGDSRRARGPGAATRTTSTSSFPTPPASWPPCPSTRRSSARAWGRTSSVRTASGGSTSRARRRPARVPVRARAAATARDELISRPGEPAARRPGRSATSRCSSSPATRRRPGSRRAARPEDDELWLGRLDATVRSAGRCRRCCGRRRTPIPSEPLPLLVAHDGPEYAELSALLRYLARLVAEGELPPHRAALLGAGRPRRVVLRLAALRQRAGRRRRCRRSRRGRRRPTGAPRSAMGASLGALAMLHAHRRSPARVRRAVPAVGQLLPAALDRARVELPPRSPGSRASSGESLRGRTGIRRRSRSTMTCGTVEENLRQQPRRWRALAAQGYDVRAGREPRRAQLDVGWRDAFDPHLRDLLRRVVDVSRDDVEHLRAADRRQRHVVAYGHWGRPLLVFPSERGSALGLRAQRHGRRARPADRRRPAEALLRRLVRRRSWSTATTCRSRSAPASTAATRTGSSTRSLPCIHARLRRLPGDPGHRRRASAPTTRRTSRSSAPTCSRSRSACPASTTVGRVGWGERGDAVYFNNPMDYVAQLHGDHLDWLRARLNLLLVCGQGQWEDTTGALDSTRRFAGVLHEKGIRHELDLWGHDVPHDWPSWRAQIAHHLPRFC